MITHVFLEKFPDVGSSILSHRGVECRRHERKIMDDTRVKEIRIVIYEKKADEGYKLTRDVICGKRLRRDN